MLKLEKTSPHSDLSIRIREREHFFEPRLLKALAFALIFHIGALSLFHVTPFFFSSNFVFSPVQVQSDSTIRGVSTFVSSIHKEEEGELSPPSPSLIPTLEWLSSHQELTSLASSSIDPNALQFLEERIWPIWHEPFSLKLEEPRIQLAISGDLAALSLVATDPILSETQSFSPDSPLSYVTYQVELNDEVGDIFWYNRIESSGVAAIDQLTEKILLSLRFSIPLTKDPIQGVLSFVIREKRKEGKNSDD